MTELNLGQSISYWLGIVVNVKDPHQSGRVQVRILGRHDDITNIPDESLPWALVTQPTTSAAIGKIGTAPVGLVKGSRVMGIWMDSDHQYPVVIGSMGKSGDSIPGQIENGAPKVNTTTGSIPSSAQASPNNPYSSFFSGRVSISSVDSGQANIFSVKNDVGSVITKEVENTMKFAKLPTVGSFGPDISCDITKMLNQIDPNGILSPLKCLPSAQDLLKSLLDMVSGLANAYIGMISNAIRNAILNLAKSLGLNNIINLLNQLSKQIKSIDSLMHTLANFSCGINPITKNVFTSIDMAFSTVLSDLNKLAGITYGAVNSIANLSSAATSQILSTVATYPVASIATAISARPPANSILNQPPGNYIRQYSQSDPYPGYIVWVDPNGEGSPVYTPRNGEPNFVSANQHNTYIMEKSITGTLGAAILSGNLNSSTLTNIMNEAEQIGKSFATSAVLGVGFNLLGGAINASDILPTINNGIKSFDTSVNKTIYTTSNSINAMNKFIQKQGLLARQAVLNRIKVSSLPSLSGSCSL